MRLIWQLLVQRTTQKRAPLLASEPISAGLDNERVLHIANDHHHVFCPGELVG
jgi:hypothetical protein